eukprot:7533700-Pyramimonas_sp.AAC.1
MSQAVAEPGEEADYELFRKQTANESPRNLYKIKPDLFVLLLTREYVRCEREMLNAVTQVGTLKALLSHKSNALSGLSVLRVGRGGEGSAQSARGAEPMPGHAGHGGRSTHRSGHRLRTGAP